MIYCPDLLPPAFTRLPAVETPLRLVTENALANHCAQQFGRLKNLTLFIFRQRFVKVLDDVTTDVETDDIKRSEGSALRSAHSLTGNLVNLFNRVTIVQHGLNRDHGAKGANAIGDKVWPVFSGNNTFTESLIEKAIEEARHFRLGPLGANYFDEMQVTGRIK